MEVKNSMYKDRPAITMTTKKFEARILPDDGGKMASLKCAKTGFELMLQSPGKEYERLHRQPYVDSECSGFDDMFPTIDPYEWNGNRFPDHGEICRLEHDVDIEDEKVKLTAESSLEPITFVKSFSESKDGGLLIDYEIANNGREDFPCLWAGHIMLTGADGAEVIAGCEAGDEIEMVFAEGDELLMLVSKRAWQGSPKVNKQDYAKESTYKYYFTGPVKEGFCGCSYPGIGKFMLTYDRRILPYLGIWINNGGFQDKRNIALEPCSAPWDSPEKAEKRGIKAILEAGGKLSFGIAFDWILEAENYRSKK